MTVLDHFDSRTNEWVTWNSWGKSTKYKYLRAISGRPDLLFYRLTIKALHKLKGDQNIPVQLQEADASSHEKIQEMIGS